LAVHVLESARVAGSAAGFDDVVAKTEFASRAESTSTLAVEILPFASAALFAVVRILNAAAMGTGHTRGA
jgi:hypothetical protein